MFRKPMLAVIGALTLAGGVLGTSTAAMADPPWARGERGFRHGGPPPWAPAHGYRRHREFGGYGRRDVRIYEGRRYGGYGGYGRY
ncbi:MULTISPECIES: hypothetical protein [Methylobacterium]|jgi:hypothetical protein|uniref:Sulfur globule protein n=1 Tax=Methylobacterium longum TaxID=767694 RepID=A0ABT8AN03_9HYPH|nr:MULTISPECIES: hypothetical protein [Methylobacterium]MCJ2099632.1 hypothetical protein [Methylobacterium sp. E-046]MDN3570830.1 hypothetical protein [Methylobacterium longum]GJE13542.1 hypothetical protein FOHLNKBM_4606 [Methylobacterium longum]